MRSPREGIPASLGEGTALLIVCGAGYVSGKEILALELGKGLAKSWSVLFATSWWHDGDFTSRLKNVGLTSYSLPLGFISATLSAKCLRMTLEQIATWPRLLLEYWRILKGVRPLKVVHTNWHPLLLLLPFLHPERDIYWLHEVVPDRSQYRKVFRWFERRIGCFVCVSYAVADSLRHLGVSEAKIKVIYNGLTDPAAEGRRPVAKTHLGFRIGIVGQVGDWKGHADLLQAFGRVCKWHPDAELFIFGKGTPEYTLEIAKMAVELGVAGRVRWKGFVADRAEIYSELDLCVVPSRSQDPLPTAAIEAGFFGLPVVATRSGGLPEIVEHEENGLLVEVEHPTEIAEAICRLIENPQLCAAMGKSGRRRAEERFGCRRFLREFGDLLDTKQSYPTSVRGA